MSSLVFLIWMIALKSHRGTSSCHLNVTFTFPCVRQHYKSEEIQKRRSEVTPGDTIPDARCERLEGKCFASPSHTDLDITYYSCTAISGKTQWGRPSPQANYLQTKNRYLKAENHVQVLGLRPKVRALLRNINVDSVKGLGVKGRETRKMAYFWYVIQWGSPKGYCASLDFAQRAGRGRLKYGS